MTERPILFSGAMVRALLAGRKTQTRRLVNARDAGAISEAFFYADRETFAQLNGDPSRFLGIRCPYGAPGDRLWVRETWAPCEAKVRKGHFQYAADGAVGHEVTTNGGERWWERSGHTMGVSDERLSGMWVSKPSRWRPSIHMPRWASRLTLEVTGGRVERLQDITEADAIAEGVEMSSRYEGRWRNYVRERESSGIGATVGDARGSFCSLWESINGAYSWASNPWVWCVSFKRVTP